MLDLSVPQRSLNRLLFFNLLTVVVILSVTFFGCNVSEVLNIVHNPLLVTKIACSYLVIANASLAAKLDKNGPSSAKSTKSTRSQVVKVAQGVGYLFAASCVAHFVAILFGAPFTQSVSETFHFASLLSATTVLPCVCFMGPSISVWLLTWNQRRKEAPLEWSIYLSSAGAVIGAWLGAFPIPLDWDRPWQVWPVSCVIGTLIGYCVGLLVSSAFLIQRIQRQRKSKAG